MDRVVVVCLHGLGRDAADWDGVRDGLARYGRVETPRLPRAGLEELVSTQRGLPADAILVGHSLGGVVALRLAAAAATPVRGVILTDSFFPPARNGRATREMLAGYAAHRVALVRDLAAQGVRPRPRTRTVRAMGSLAVLGVRPDRFHMTAAAVTSPVLVLHGRDDHHVPVEFALAAAARHSAWSVRILDGGHDVHVVHPEEWLMAATRWLDTLLQGRGTT